VVPVKPAVTLNFDFHAIHYFHTDADAEAADREGAITTDLAGTDFYCLNISCDQCPASGYDNYCENTLHQLLLKHYPDLPQTHPEYFL
jgi:hypothetical protein